MAMSPVQVLDGFSIKQLEVHESELQLAILAMTEIHIACCQVDGTIATFLPPYDEAKRARMVKYYHGQIDDVRRGKRAIFLSYLPDSAGDRRLAGLVMLAMPETETGPFRGEVEKLLVSPDFRQRGVSRNLMDQLERFASANGRTLLSLDTVEGSPAEFVYPKLGYIECGRKPLYGYSPIDHSLKGAVLFYKILEGHPGQ